LVLRKGSKREFLQEADKKRRRESAIFWEERNIWFSDVWFDIKGTTQKLTGKEARKRSGAYPFELVYRLINMYSVKNDTVLDPFLGSGTTMVAAIASGRNSIGYEIDRSMKDTIFDTIDQSVDFANDHMMNRLKNHLSFIKARIESKKSIKYVNHPYNFPVVTGQETELSLNKVISLNKKQNHSIEVHYDDAPQATMVLSDDEKDFYTELKKTEIQLHDAKKSFDRYPV
jgi:DNA modification methylase